jgi:hypothetical protein
MKEWESLLSLVAVSAAVGCQAQLMKGSTGAAWGLLTFVLLSYLSFVRWPDGIAGRRMRHFETEETICSSD